MNITYVIPCVKYDDFLNITLSTNKKHFSNVIIVTTSDDDKTIKLAKSHKLQYITTNEWFVKGAKFNKGRALNVALKHVKTDWVCTIDADIILPDELSYDNLDDNYLYSSKRRLCYNKRNYDPEKNFSDYELEKSIIKMKRNIGYCAWSDDKLKTDTSAGMMGYFQLWNKIKHNVSFPYHYPNADRYDVRFAQLWGNKRSWLEFQVLHLGWCKTNWQGRITKRWD